MGRIIEHTPGNLASHITMPREMEGFFAFFGNEASSSSGGQQQWPAARSAASWTPTWSSNTGQSSHAGYGTSRTHAQSSYAGWDSSTSGWQDQEWPTEQVPWATPDSLFYGAAEQQDYYSGTDTDTSSSLGDTDHDFRGVPEGDDNTRAQYLYWLYSQAKKRWRSFTGKPVRRVRRFFRKPLHKGGKGKGKGKGKPRHKGRIDNTFLADYSPQELEHIFVNKGKSRGGQKGKLSSGKGFGRKGNPKGKDGSVMACHGCGSLEHLIRDCPKGKGKGKPSGDRPPGHYQGFTMIADAGDDAGEDDPPLIGILGPSEYQGTVENTNYDTYSQFMISHVAMDLDADDPFGPLSG